MLFNKASGVGLFIDEKSVYVAELHTQFGSVKVVRSATLDFSSDPLDIQSVPPVISSALANAGIHSKDVFVALSEKDSIVRYFEMPILPRKERQNAARFESQKYVPFNIQELYCDYEIMIDKPQKEMKVQLLAAKKRTVDSMMALMQNAGLKVRSLESASLALVRSLDPQGVKNPNQGISAVINIDKRFIRILIVKNHMLLMTHHRVLYDLNFQSCVAQIRLLFHYFSKNLRNKEISRVVLCADMENDFKGWDQLLSGELGITIETLKPPEYYSRGRTYSLGMLTAIGLGLNGISQNNSVRLNLVSKWKPNPYEEVKALSPVEEKKLLQKVALIELVALLLIFSLAHYFLLGKISSQRLASVKEESSAISAQMALPLDQLEIKSAELNKRISFLAHLIDKRISLTVKLNEIAKIIPANINLISMDYLDNEDKDGLSTVSLRMEGMVLSKEKGLEWPAVEQLVLAFTKDKEFMQGLEVVKIASVQNSSIKDTRMTKFAIDCSGAKKL